MAFTFVFTLILFVVFLIFLVHMVNSLSKNESYSDHPFECGISSNFSSRNSYSLPFFLITLLFLMFDVEIILLFVLIFSDLSSMFFMLYMVILFLLIASLLLEWNYGSLAWMKL
uniref:NADH-ubiquinone oxidoreductase chain 3 n=1 Tax=Liposcelis bostrychophila TaxID=185214 RepID=A0A3S6PU86_LIPBO|nr:NADH dehydrogenase subunit 3 [Liposcelis bostrychophila]ATU74604.1 NADH dehydrogenase subunit 3 [Liposcelis bostrychophila]UNO31818.1 NADH dehydrogenase subunit 3 [Liposcelis bostrychophila]